jgi:hypothetical protein
MHTNSFRLWFDTTKHIKVNVTGYVKVARAHLDNEHVGKALDAAVGTLFGLDTTTNLTTEQTQST